MLAIEFFERGVARFPNTVLVKDQNQEFTYAEMDVLAGKIARALVANGVKPGERVAILSPNHPMVLACQYGLIRAGGVWTPANYRNLPPDTARQFNTLGVSFVFFHSSLADHIAAIKDEIPTLKGMVCIDKDVPLAPALSEWAKTAGEDVALPTREMDDPVVILTTSGTTGLPKGAVHSNHSIESMIASYYAVLPFDEPPVHLVVAPLTHAAGVYHWSLLGIGGTHVLAPSADPETIMQMIEKHKVSVLFLPPTVIYMMLAHPNLKKYDYSSLRYFIYGAAPMSVDKLKEAVDAFGPVMTQNYGQSECLMMAAVLTKQEHMDILTNENLRHRIAAAGREAPLSRVEIMDDEGNLLPNGEIGEIVFRAPYLMVGYFNNPEGTAETRCNGWHRTGDVGIKDKDGYVYLVDRKKDMIISGGFNLYPGEIEQTVLAHPAVQDAAVVGIPDEKWGETVLAALELKPGAAFDEAEFIAFCKAKLGSVKAPKHVEIWNPLPRSTVGKTLRRVVRAKYWEGRSRTI